MIVMTITKRLSHILVTSILIYFGICLTLIFLPIPAKKNVENYDYSSLTTSTQKIKVSNEQTLVTRDNEELFFRSYESNSDTTLILLHGSGSESRYLSQVAAHLSNQNIMRVITPDLRGHGRNKGPKGDVDYIGQLDHDVEDVIAYAKKTYPNTKIVLGGHSSGGGMALRYVGNNKVSQPDALLLLAPYLGHDSPTVKPSSGDWVTVALKRWIGLEMINNLGITALNDLPVLIFNRPETWNDDLQVTSYSYRMAVNFAPNNYIDDIANISVPTLVLIGEKDESFYPEQFTPVFANAKHMVDTQIVQQANHMNIVDSSTSINLITTWKSQLPKALSHAKAH